MFFKKKTVEKVTPPVPKSKWEQFVSGHFSHILILYILVSLLSITVFLNMFMFSKVNSHTDDLYLYVQKHEKRIQVLENSTDELMKVSENQDKIIINNYYQDSSGKSPYEAGENQIKE